VPFIKDTVISLRTVLNYCNGITVFFLPFVSDSLLDLTSRQIEGLTKNPGPSLPMPTILTTFLENNTSFIPIEIA